MDAYTQMNRAVASALTALASGTVGERTREGLASIFNFFNASVDLSAVIGWLQIFAALISAVFVYFIAVAIIHKRIALSTIVATPSVPATTPEPVSSGGALRSRWDAVVAHLDSSREADWKLAVMEADKLADEALAQAGFGGATFGDRLTNIAPGTLASLDGLWWSHKVRNRLAHELDYFLRYTEARQAIGYYQQALEELRMI